MSENIGQSTLLRRVLIQLRQMTEMSHAAKKNQLTKFYFIPWTQDTKDMLVHNKQVVKFELVNVFPVKPNSRLSKSLIKTSE